MADLVKALVIGFASEYAFAIKAQNFHWNVEGPLFAQYHTLFGEIYAEVQGAQDIYAEQIRAMDGYAPGSLGAIQSMSTIADSNSVLPAIEMIAQLLADCNKLAELHSMLFKMSEVASEFGLSDFLAARQNAYRKHAWMLRASLK